MEFFRTVQKIKNPNYKGKWKIPWIDNPGEYTVDIISHLITSAVMFGEINFNCSFLCFSSSSEFEDDPDLYVLKPIKYVGIEVWQVG